MARRLAFQRTPASRVALLLVVFSIAPKIAQAQDRTDFDELSNLESSALAAHPMSKKMFVTKVHGAASGLAILGAGLLPEPVMTWNGRAEAFARLRFDRFVAVSSRLGGTDDLQNPDAVWGTHQFRGSWGFGDRHGMLAPSLELEGKLRHGPTDGLLSISRREPVRIDEREGRATLWLRKKSSRKWFMNANHGWNETTLLPISMQSMRRELTAGNTLRAVDVRRVSSGLGTQFMVDARPDGWFEYLGVALSQTRFTANEVGAVKRTRAPPQTITRLDLRAANFNRWLNISRGARYASLDLAYTWLWGQNSAQSNSGLVGGLSFGLPCESGFLLDLGIARRIRVAQSTDQFVSQWRGEARTGIKLQGHGAELRYVAARESPMGVVEPGATGVAWFHTLRSRWYFEPWKNVAVGAKHMASYGAAPEFRESRAWTHYLGAYLEFSARAGAPVHRRRPGAGSSPFPE